MLHNAAHNPAMGWEAANPEYKSPRLKTIDPLALDGKAIPPRRWLVDGWIPMGAVTMLAGDGGVGKSLLAMQLATACAIGQPWLGQHTMACKALGLWCEDDSDELQRRQDSINRHYGVGFGDLENLTWVSRPGADSVMMTFNYDVGTATEFCQSVHNLAIDTGAQLVVLDSLHDLFAGNENIRPQARQFINLLRGLAIDIEGAVVLCSHPSQSGLASGSGSSGSTAWNNTVRSRLYLTKPSVDEGAIVDDAERVLQRVKSNYSSTGDSLDLIWRDGVFQPVATPQGLFAGMATRNAETAFLDGLDALTRAGRNLSDNSHSGNYAPKLIMRTVHGKRHKLQELAGAMERLFSDGKIRVEDYGPDSKRRARIARADGDEK